MPCLAAAFALALLFGPAGHLYLKGGVRYIVLMYAAWVGLLIATPLPLLVSSLLLAVLSGFAAINVLSTGSTGQVR